MGLIIDLNPTLPPRLCHIITLLFPSSSINLLPLSHAHTDPSPDPSHPSLSLPPTSI